ncbi:hypothetical protein NDU88_000389 [Pleurodeles waltl]|uniref:Ig-like domain-containing protein n=1 Tax=Pleurodeles waltl TaxID=8319 RepID=A0AAV7P3V1_PLEWA|nr:hypothetical protein NDU88_000389 [Pleurodeles waltl]
MAPLLLFVFIFFGFLSGASSYVDQPPFTFGIPGETAALLCELKDSAKLWMYWYRAHPGRAMEALFSSLTGADVTNFTSELLTAHRRDKTFELRFSKLQLADTAVFYCACSTAH